ncbi:MAG TPA: peroxidase family protein [Chitinophagales bacterium]|nr:peroxidase family protein [Chitinophagales bacterium]
MKKHYILTTALSLIIVTMPFKVIAQEKLFVEGFPARSFTHSARGTNYSLKIGSHLPYRSYDGTNNNTSSETRAVWGATDIPLVRGLPTEYGSSDPNNAMGGENRPSAREISNVLCYEPVTQFNDRNLSTFVYVWGQFLDHDISLTPQDTTEYAPVSLPGDEPLFTQDIPFFRSKVYPGTGVTNARQQFNSVTAWIDASMVYGSDSTRAAWLRTFENGKMKTSAGNLLPWNTVTGEQSDAIDLNAPSMDNDAGHTVKTFVAGDVRAAEHPGITSLHTLFVREHNRICDEYIAQGFTNDEKIYQMARKQVGALIQAITYQEFLPALGISLNSYTTYKSNVRPDIPNTFSTAGYRLGHTWVADEIALCDNDCQEVNPGQLDLVDVFFNPEYILDYGLEPFLKGFATHKQYETDNKINSVLRDFLFGEGFGIDLASLNIQRGRDHGLPDYNAVRQFYTGSAVTSFLQITSDTTKAAALESLYGDVNDIDLWIGLLAEDHVPGKSVGKTINAMLTSQFRKLRDGDYYFYEYDPYLPASTRNVIKNTTFADVIKRNTTLTNLQTNVFFTQPCPGDNGEDKLASTLTGDNESTGFLLYPNPVSDFINIDLNKSYESCSIKLFSTTGILLKTIPVAKEKNLQIDMNDVASGVYFLQIITNRELKSFSLVKI